MSLSRNKTERSVIVACMVFLTYLILIGFALLGDLPLWVFFLAIPLNFVGGMLYEQEKCSEDGPIRRETRT